MSQMSSATQFLSPQTAAASASATSVNLQIILAGFGGQGILFAGKLIAYAGLLDGREVSWLPSYGPEMRGGTANCSVCLADEPIGSPLISVPDVLIAFNLPSFQSFVNKVRSGGLVIVDSTMVDACPLRDDLRFERVASTQLAEDNGLKGLGNVIMVGKLLQLSGFSSLKTLEAAIDKSVSVKHQDLIGANKQALAVGYAHIGKQECQ